MMENSDSNAWVFDSLVGFLHGPVWNVPLQTFIEEKSLPFEPTDNGEVLDRPEYKQVHEQYKNLVDVMLGSFMDDIGITPEQFSTACQLSARDLAGLPSQFHRRLFQQIWAANDYHIFVKMMTHKNVELQLQALDLIERRFGTLPNIFSQQSQSSGEQEDWSDKDDVMTEVKQLELKDLSIKDDEDVQIPREHVVEQKTTLLTKLHSFEGHTPAETTETTSAGATAPKPEISKVPPPKKLEVSEEEMLARKKYLKQQRDKLLDLKKQVRERRLGEESPRPRPKSARVARAALAGTLPGPAPDSLQLRKALAERLRNEVVDTAL